MSDEIFEQLSKLVESNGDEVGMDSPVCILWKSEHNNCIGCPSELGCSKVMALMGVSLTPLIYTPKDYNDFEQMRKSIQDKIDKIMSAKTAEEVRSIEW